ncbi:putative J domain-containing protein C17A3.05c [Bienertia sinuspersici]
MNRGREASASSQQYHHEEDEEHANLSPSQLLQLAETHLRLRNFSICRQYALESQQPNDPHSLSNHRQASQLLAISNILSSPTNYYSILQIDTFSNDFTLIRSKFKHLLSLLDPIKNNSTLANEAVNLVWKAYGFLSDPAKKAQFDSQISAQKCGFVEGEEVDTFWTFCPYCFYMYQYARVYEGCCLRCQNQTCRRAFHGVAVNSLPSADLEKGKYFSCFGYFPLGFSPEENGEKKFDSWSPIVGLFPVKRIGKTRAGRVDLNDDNNNNVNVDAHFIEILDENDEVENDQGVNFGSNINAGKPRRKSVAWNARKLMSKGRMSGNEGVANGSEGYGDEDVDEGFMFEDGQGGDVVGSGFEADDMAFFEEGGEIFVEFGDDDAL